MPRALVLAGPNGAGKTTISRKVALGEYLDPDEVERGLINVGPVPVRPAAAGRQILRRMEELVAAGADFSTETTLAGLSATGRMRRWRAAGYHCTLIFVALSDPDLAVQRVRGRVAQKGHGVPGGDDVVIRRWHGGLRQFFAEGMHIADSWLFLDNSDLEALVVVAAGEGSEIQLFDPARWEAFRNAAGQ